MKILIIEDDPTVIQLITEALQSKWVEVNLISTIYGEEGIELTKKELPDIVILDLMLEDIDGFEVLGKIRVFSDVLVVILTARGDEDSMIRGLQEGADEYIVKPFSPGELIARMKSLIRRMEITKSTPEAARKPPTRKLSIDYANQTASVGGSLLRMGPSSYELLYLLVTNEGSALNKKELMKKVFPERGDDTDTGIVDVYINKIRESLEVDPKNPKMILNDGETGYKFVGSYSMVREALKEWEQ
jgi:DNA-binding response OmpR family regulator